MSTPRELAKEAGDKAWWGPAKATGMMQDAVGAALAAFAKAHAEEFRGLGEHHRKVSASQSYERSYHWGFTMGELRDG